MSLGSTPVAEKRRYYAGIAAAYVRFVEGGEIGTIGDIRVEHKVVILRGPGAKESYQLLKNPPND